VGELFLSNSVSASSAQRLLADASAAGAKHVADLARVGGAGKHPKNACRDLMRRMLRGRRRHWPPLYKAAIVAKDPKGDDEVSVPVSFLLPHAVVGHLMGRAPGSLEHLLPTATRAPELREHIAQVSADLGLAGQVFVPLGLHGDGVPYNADRTKSLEVYSFNFPAWEQAGLAFRCPITGIPKDLMVKGRTVRSIMEVVVWSLQMLMLGVWPTRRHDGSAWAPSDPSAQLAGTSLGCRGLVVEIRGDWAWFKETLGLPGWQEKAGCCWRCPITLKDLREVGEQAAWRTSRLSHDELLQRVRSRGLEPSPLLGLPGVTNEVVLPDWLHAVDLGIGADIVGNLLWAALPKLPGDTLKAKVRALWARLREWYRAHRVQSQLQTLTVLMLKQPKKAPKLRAKGAELRALVPFAAELAEALLDATQPVELTMVMLGRELRDLYSHMQNFAPARLAEASRRVAKLWVALEARSPEPLWRIKPKLHLAQELCEVVAFARGSPRSFWTYRDEDFGGKMAIVGRRRGGRGTALAVSTRLLQRFVCRHELNP
jgi:hypothetical protein